MTDKAEYDAEILRQLVDGIGADGTAEVIRTLVDDAPRLMGELRGALDRGAPEAVRLHAHTLKSSARIVGAMAVAEECESAEMLAVSATDLAGARAPAEAAMRRFDRLVADLRDWLKALEPR